MKQRQSILHLIAGGIFILSASGLLTCGVLNGLPEITGLETFAVTSGSMEPTIAKGSLIFVNTRERTPVKGAVLTCKLGGDENRTVTHRVTEVLEDGTFLLKGDANDTADLSVTSPDDVIGTVVQCLPHLGITGNTDWLRIVLIIAMSASGVAFVCMEPEKTMKGVQDS